MPPYCNWNAGGRGVRHELSGQQAGNEVGIQAPRLEIRVSQNALVQRDGGVNTLHDEHVERSAVMQLELGARGPETSFVTACFVLDDPLARQILAVLPPVIRMTPDAEQGVPSFAENIQFITREIETDRPGSEIVLLRMADVIFIQILRAYLARVPDDGEDEQPARAEA